MSKVGHPYFEQGKTAPYTQAPYNSADLKGPAMTAAVPLRRADGRLLAVLAARLDLAALNTIAQRRTRVRQTEEAFLINADRLLVTQPRSLRVPAVLRRVIETESATRCVTGTSGVITNHDYRGVPVISVYRWIPDYDLCLIVKIDQAEALAPARAFKEWVLLISALALLGTAGLATFLARTITRPLRALHQSVGSFAEGGGEGPLSSAGGDEVASLAGAFTQMQTRVQQRTSELAESNSALLTENAERRRAEEVLRESEEKFHQLADNITDIFWIGSLDLQQFHYVSPAMERIFGVPTETLYAKPLIWIEGIVPEDRDRVIGAFLKLAEEPIAAVEYRVALPDGSIRWMHNRGFQVRDAGGHPYRVAGIATDITARKRGELALRESEARTHAIVESALDCIATVDHEGRILEFNPAAETVFGRKRADVLGREFGGVCLPPGYGYQLRLAMRRYLATREATILGKRLEVTAVRSDGRKFPAEFSISRLGTEWPPTFAGFIRDLSEHKAAEADLQRLRIEYGLILDSVVEGVHWVDVDGLIKFENPAAARQLGYEVSELVGQPAHATMHHTHVDGTPYPVQECSIYTTLTDGVARRVQDEVFWRKDGTSFPVEYTCTPIRDEAGGSAGCVVVFSDITERRKAEQQLSIQSAVSLVLAESVTAEEAAHKLLQVICENVGCDVGAVWTVDQRDHVVRCTEVWSRSGRSIDEFRRLSLEQRQPLGVGLPGRVWATGRPAWVGDVGKDQNFHRAHAALAIGLRSAFAFPIMMGTQVTGVLEFFSREGRDLDAELLHTFTILGSQFGQFVQGRQLEGQLLQSQRMETVGKLAGGVAHEFNSILTAIIGQSDMLLADLPANDPLVKNATEIRKAADRAASLTRQLLAYGRKQMLRLETLDLNQIVAGLEGMLLHLMGGDVDVRIIPATGLHSVQADSGQLDQVLMNIAINAREAMPHGGTLTLETSNFTLDEEITGSSAELKPGDYAVLSITDTGKGMSPAVKARVFEPFFTTKGAGEGTGLGLATSYGIIKQSGGHMTVYSELGRGTSFKIYLPHVQRSAAPRPQLREPPDLPHGTETILLVEDDPALREMAAMLLQRLGYDVLTAAGGADALRLLEQQGEKPVDLLFTDVVMPHLDGKELADRILASHPKTKVLFTSAYTENSMVHQGVLGASMALLQKPFTPSALAHKVRQVLDQHDGILEALVAEVPAG
jgi:PAS domain S-box-containing protein